MEVRMEKECPDWRYLFNLSQFVGTVIRTNFENHNVSLKDDETPVTNIDSIISEYVVDKIRDDFPLISVFTEEDGVYSGDGEYLLICDPIDGTLPYTMGLAYAAFSIVLLRRGEALISVIHDPFVGRSWVGRKDDIPFSNWGKISVSSRKELAGSSLAALYWPGVDSRFGRAARRAEEQGAYVLNPGAVSLFGALVAIGKFDGVIFPSKKYWEALAIKLLVEGAGGKVSDSCGHELVYDPRKEMHGMVASNGHLHNQLLNLLE